MIVFRGKKLFLRPKLNDVFVSTKIWVFVIGTVGKTTLIGTTTLTVFL